MDEPKNKSKAIELAVASIEKEYGKGSIMRLKDGASMADGVQVVSTGSIGLDIALGIGGYPRGRIVEIYGPESSGKTTLTLHAIAQVQKAGGVAAFIDAEHALDPTYARKLGVKTDELLVTQPDYGEQALEIADMLVRSDAVDLIVIDSVAALVPKAEIEGDMGDSHVGLQARLMSQALRKLTVHGVALQLPPHLHQPDPHEDRRHVRQPGDDDGRQRAQVLREPPPRHPPHRRHQGGGAGGRKRPGGGRQPHAREGGEEQDGAAVPRGRVRHPLRPGHLALGRHPRSRRASSASSRRAAPGSRSAASASGRAARTPRRTSSSTPRRSTRSRP